MDRGLNNSFEGLCFVYDEVFDHFRYNLMSIFDNCDFELYEGFDRRFFLIVFRRGGFSMRFLREYVYDK